MDKRDSVRFLELAGLVIGLLLLLPVSDVAAEQQQQSYAKTIAALQQRYMDEVTAHQKYNAYALRAEEEDYPNIAHLFRSLAASEGVHARNFRRLLSDLGIKAKLPEKPDINIATTKDNIWQATTVEADEIDNEYPKILESIVADNHKQAILFITYAWEAEKQHRDLMLKIKKASKRFFWILTGYIEGEPTRYYVCQICGSTLTELPDKHCPICKHPASDYKEVAGFPGYPEDAE